MNPSIIAAIAYGILSIVGGVIGYIQAQSKVSLISGIVSGLLLILGGILQAQGIGGGLIISVIVSLVLVIVFIGRLVKTRKVMPAGLMIAAGVIALIVMLQDLLT